MPAVLPSSARRRLLVACAIGFALVALAVAWTVTPLADLLDPARLSTLEQQLRAWPLAPLALMGVFALSGVLAAPATLMIGATVLLFGAWPGALYALAGMLVSGLTVYAIGRFGTRALVQEWLARRADPRIDAFNRRIERRGFVTMVLMRLTPVPYSLQNLLAGASRIGLVDFVLGTAVGILPVITLMTGLANELNAWIEHPSSGQLLVVLGVAVVVAAVGWSIRRWAVR